MSFSVYFSATFTALHVVMGFRDVGSISNMGGRHFKGTFYEAKGAIPEHKRALLCLLQNLGGHMPPVPPPIPVSLLGFLCFLFLC